MYKTETFSPLNFTAGGTISLNNNVVSYHTVCEDNVFYNEEGKAIASIFSYSYFRSDVDNAEQRPVLFCFNGGPGTSSMMLHVGLLGPYRTKYSDDPDNPSLLSPYDNVIENPQCLLDIADIVMIDPVGTGYGLLIDESESKRFYGIEEDAEALLAFIDKWLTKYQRWQSPKFLLGESYGCKRVATALGLALGRCNYSNYKREFALAFDGAILIGNTVNDGKYIKYGNGMVFPVEDSVLGFPSYAAVNWYHNRPSKQTVDKFVADAKHFADTEYLQALYRGNDLSEDEKQTVMNKIMYFTGVSKEYLESAGMRIDQKSVRNEFLRREKRSVGRLDGRITRSQYSTALQENMFSACDDPSDKKYTPYFLSAIHSVVFPALNIHTDRPFVSSYRMMEWNHETPNGTSAEQLSAAMSRTSKMRAFFANGWYDLCTLIGNAYYTIAHADFPKDRTFIKGYPSGHMIYIGEENVKELAGDIRTFIQNGDPTK